MPQRRTRSSNRKPQVNPSRRPATTPKREAPTSNVTRHHLAIAVLVMVVASAIFAGFEPSAQNVFDKAFQLLLLIIGYYFIRK
jgi:hypothetical protein